MEQDCINNDPLDYPCEEAKNFSINDMQSSICILAVATHYSNSLLSNNYFLNIISEKTSVNWIISITTYHFTNLFSFQLCEIDRTFRPHGISYMPRCPSSSVNELVNFSRVLVHVIDHTDTDILNALRADIRWKKREKASILLKSDPVIILGRNWLISTITVYQIN